MAMLYAELADAIDETLATAVDQSAEFKRRLKRLIENAVTGNLMDNDVREVVELANVDESAES